AAGGLHPERGTIHLCTTLNVAVAPRHSSGKIVGAAGKPPSGKREIDRVLLGGVESPRLLQPTLTCRAWGTFARRTARYRPTILRSAATGCTWQCGPCGWPSPS